MWRQLGCRKNACVRNDSMILLQAGEKIRAFSSTPLLVTEEKKGHQLLEVRFSPRN